MSYKRVLTIQDVSCVGQCSGTVALPLISACGHECAIIPSAVLSTHTGGFSGFTFSDLTQELPGIRQHWEKENIKFDSIYTGYLGSVEQVDYVLDIMDSCLKPGGLRIVDPAMADNGQLYGAFDMTYVEAMKMLVGSSDITLPNVTEACFLTGTEYKAEYDQDYIHGLLSGLSALGCKCVILTGVSYKPGYTGVVIYEDGFISYYEHEALAKHYHGTGDVYASVFTGALMQDVGAVNAACVAADFVVDSIKATMEDEDHWYGVKFEAVIPELVKTLFSRE
ncbi:MAG: pyridoxamine kinase [Parasporobacterium sp.]|nr:pyridoxamine kinase [Parasporobacterium sp.]